MASARLRDDVIAYRKALRQSVDPLSYQLDPAKYIHSHTCRPVLGIVGGNNVSTVPNMVDAESSLWNLTQPAIYDGAAVSSAVFDAMSARKNDLHDCQFQKFKRMPHAVWDTPFDGQHSSRWRRDAQVHATT